MGKGLLWVTALLFCQLTGCASSLRPDHESRRQGVEARPLRIEGRLGLGERDTSLALGGAREVRVTKVNLCKIDAQGATTSGALIDVTNGAFVGEMPLAPGERLCLSSIQLHSDDDAVSWLATPAQQQFLSWGGGYLDWTTTATPAQTEILALKSTGRTVIDGDVATFDVTAMVMRVVSFSPAATPTPGGNSAVDGFVGLLPAPPGHLTSAGLDGSDGLVRLRVSHATSDSGAIEDAVVSLHNGAFNSYLTALTHIASQVATEGGYLVGFAPGCKVGLKMGITISLLEAGLEGCQSFGATAVRFENPTVNAGDETVSFDVRIVGLVASSTVRLTIEDSTMVDPSGVAPTTALDVSLVANP